MIIMGMGNQKFFNICSINLETRCQLGDSVVSFCLLIHKKTIPVRMHDKSFAYIEKI